MRQVFQKSYLSKELCVEEVPAPSLSGSGALIRNVASLISPGTERATVSFARKGILEKIKSQPERVQLLLRRMQQHGVLETLQLARRKLESPIPMGYSAAGMIVEVSDDLPGFGIGQRVACAGAGHANHAEVTYVPKNLFVPLPDNLSFEEGSFVAPGAIALHGVRLAEIGLGETVVVIGLGLIGQLTMQLVKAQGGITIGIDLSHERLELARELGADHVLHRNDPGLEQMVLSLTGGRGADRVLITAATTSQDPITLAGELARDRGKVVVVGDVGMHVPRSVYYHKELSLVVSRSYGPGRYDEAYERRGADYPAAYVRWTERDNMAVFLDLAARGKIALAPLITHRFALADAKAAYDLLTDPAASPQPLGMVLQYPQPEESKSESGVSTRLNLGATAKTEPLVGKVGLGVVGAGNFLRSTLLPLLKKQPSAALVGIASNNGLSAKTLGDQYGFRYCATDARNLLEDSNVQSVLIATRHDSHAELVYEALAHGKHVFVEKPLATTPEELARCVDALRAHPKRRLMIGFNRRFAPFSRQVKALLNETSASRPLSVTYRVNAGPAPEASWVHQHGGRIVGEVCHFVDWMLYITGETPVRVFAQSAGEGANQDVTVQLSLSGGSTGSIHYAMRADTSLGKERIEVFSPTLTAEIDDFKHMRIHHRGKTRDWKFKKPEKGHREELDAWFQCLETGEFPPIPVEELILTTQTTFAILESLKLGAPVSIYPLITTD